MADYDYIMNGAWEHRVRLFDALPEDEKADLARIHRRRWLEANRQRLADEQVAAIEEEIAFLVPALYRSPKDRELFRLAKLLEEKALSLFSRQDLYQLTLHGDRVPEMGA